MFCNFVNFEIFVKKYNFFYLIKNDIINNLKIRFSRIILLNVNKLYIK